MRVEGKRRSPEKAHFGMPAHGAPGTPRTKCTAIIPQRRPCRSSSSSSSSFSVRHTSLPISLANISMLSQARVPWASPGKTPWVGACHSIPTPVPSLVLRFVKDQFDDYRESTIGGGWPFPLEVVLGVNCVLCSGFPHTNSNPRGLHDRQIRDMASSFSVRSRAPLLTLIVQGHRRSRTIQGAHTA